MTLLESLLLGLSSLGATSLGLGFLPRKPVRLFTFGLLSTLLLAHLGSDGPRWQIIPAYLLFLGLILAWIPGVEGRGGRPARGRASRYLLRALGVGWLMGAWILPVSLPVSGWPSPSGDFPVGTRFLVLTDSTRAETFEPASGESRTIPIQAWYPAEAGCPEPTRRYWESPWRMSSAWAQGNDLGWAPFLWSHLGRIPTEACPGASISSLQGSYPVLIFSHGYWQAPEFNRALLEELASRGYVVLSVTHAFETPYARYPDGEIRIFSRANPEFRRRVEEQRDPSRWMILGEAFAATTWAEQEPLFQEWVDGIPAWQESNEIWTEDILHAISSLSWMGPQEFENRLDPDRIGVLGFSFGGGASGLATLTDPRIRAGINIDGFQYGYTAGTNLQAPFMFISSEDHGGANDFFWERSEAPVYEVVVQGSKHSNFTDLALLAGLPGRISGRLGSIDGHRGMAILNHFVSGFLDVHLKGATPPTPLGPSPAFPEARVRKRSPPPS